MYFCKSFKYLSNSKRAYNTTKKKLSITGLGK